MFENATGHTEFIDRARMNAKQKLCRILNCENVEEAKGFCKEHLADPLRRQKPWKPLFDNKTHIKDDGHKTKGVKE